MATGKYAKFKGFRWTKGNEDVPALALLVDDYSKQLHICEPGDADTDWAVAVCTHPTVFIHSATDPATEYVKIYHDATNAYIDGVGATALQFLVAGTKEVDLTATALSPATTDGNALGTTALMWSDLFLASGGVINFNNGDVTITHSAGALAVAATWATAAATGRPFGVTLTVNAALGGWSNAVKGYVAYGAAGSTTGLGSAVNAEILLSTGTTSGTYAPLESELVANSAVSSGTATSFFYGNIAGTNSTGKTTLNTNGYLFELGAGVVDTASGLFDVATTTPTSVEFDAQLRIRVGGVNYYIPLSADTAFE